MRHSFVVLIQTTVSSRIRRIADLILPLCTVFFLIQVAAAQVAAAGQQLTVTTANATAKFQGPDLVGFTNSASGESYLKSAAPSPLMNLEINGIPSSSLQVSNWTTSVQGGTTVGSLTVQDAVRTIVFTVKVDPTSQEIVINLSGQASQTGVSAAYWGIAGLDLSAGRLVLPASSGIVIDQQHVQLGSRLQYPLDWQAQMAVYETSAGSMLLYSTDFQGSFKQLRISTHSKPTIDLSIASQPNGPFSSRTSVPTLEWRLKAFAGDWRTAAAVYRDWLAANRPPLSNANHAWVTNIRTVVQLGTRDPSVLNTLATEVTPSETLLYIPDWRTSGYDVNYPDYTPASDVPSFVAQAHTLGFKVMLHTDLIGVSPNNPDFASVQQWQLKDPQTLHPEGWNWSSPPSTPQRYAAIDPAAPVYRSLFISRVTVAVNAVQPDALHLDFTGMYNDGNGLINGMSYPQGVLQLHKDLIAAFPNLAFGDEGMNDLAYPYVSFAQAFGTADNTALLGHPIANFLWNSQSTGPQILYYGHLGQPAATAPGFIDSLSPIEHDGILPALAVNGASDLDLTSADNARLNRWLTSWQVNGFEPDWSGSWSNVLIPYKGAGNAAATLTDTGSIVSLNAGGSMIYQRAHDANQISTTNYVLNWPAFDSTHIYGLDPTKQYWLDAVTRPNTTHISSLASSVELGAETAVSSTFAFIQLAPTPSFDFFKNLFAATIGITFNGVDSALGFGATTQLAQTTAGGVTRTGVAMEPPFQQGYAGGEAFVEWALPIPPSAAFSFSVGVADSAGTCTDGVTFRVVVNGVEQWRQNVLHQGWVDGTVNLTGYAGTTARLRIVTNPGPANNPNCDWASFSNLALVQSAGMTSVPMVLGPGAVASGFTGSGTYSANTSTVSGAAVPGQFVLFTAPGTAVSAATSLASVPFTSWLGGDGRLPAPGTIFGSGTLGNATSGGVMKQNAIFAHPPLNGRTILNWTLALPSTGNLQLGWSAGIGDGSLSSTGVQFSVRINGITYWTMFQGGPAGWTPASLDLSSWRGQNILVQLVTDSVGNNDYDWAWWADLNLAPGGTSPPPAPVLTAPANSATVAVSNPTLTWSAAAGASSYDVYFGPSSPPPIVANASSTSYSPGRLLDGTYYWKIVSRSNTGIAASVVWQFTVQSSVSNGLGFFPITPCRAVDTRASQSKTGAFGPPAMAGYSGRDFPLMQSGCGLPSNAQAYSLNFTVVPPGPLDFLSAWPSNQPFPGVSTLNSPDGSTIANAAIVPNDPNGKIKVTTGQATDLIIDTNGYFAAPNGSELAFYPLTPCRIVDTRPSQGKTGAFGPPALIAYTGRTFPVRSSSCQIPNTAAAYALNLTVVPPGPLSFLSIWPADKPFPGVSTLNSNDGSIIANAAIVPAAANGDVIVTAGNATDFVMDINGYFAAPGAPGALHFYPLAPCRVADTRPSQGFTGAFGPPGLTPYQGRSFPMQQSACSVPSTAQAYSLNITVVPQGALSFLSAWPSDKPFPGVSTLNSPKGLAIANAAIVPAAAYGNVTVTAGNATDLIIDINGYFAP